MPNCIRTWSSRSSSDSRASTSNTSSSQEMRPRTACSGRSDMVRCRAPGAITCTSGPSLRSNADSSTRASPMPFMG